MFLLTYEIQLRLRCCSKEQISPKARSKNCLAVSSWNWSQVHALGHTSQAWHFTETTGQLPPCPKVPLKFSRTSCYFTTCTRSKVSPCKVSNPTEDAYYDLQQYRTKNCTCSPCRWCVTCLQGDRTWGRNHPGYWLWVKETHSPQSTI